MVWRRINRATKLISRIFKIFKNENKWQTKFRKKYFENISKKFEFKKKRRKHDQDILNMSSCTKFQFDISENGRVIRFFIFQYTGYIIPQKFKCMFWHVIKVGQENNLGDLKVNEIRFRSTVLAGPSNAVWILKIEPVVSEKGGGGALKSPQSVALWDIPQSGAG